MKSSGSKKERQPTLFQMEKSDVAGSAGEARIERPYSLPGILLGTSSFTATGWQGSFYPRGMKSRDFLSYYATQFGTVEIDSTFYGCPSPSTVNNWAARTPEDLFDLITADFAYVRWLGDRKGIEEQTKTWDKTIVDRQTDLKNWVNFLNEMVLNKKLRKLFALANNHYAGHGPATVKLFHDLWKAK